MALNDRKFFWEISESLCMYFEKSRQNPQALAAICIQMEAIVIKSDFFKILHLEISQNLEVFSGMSSVSISKKF